MDEYVMFVDCRYFDCFLLPKHQAPDEPIDVNERTYRPLTPIIWAVIHDRYNRACRAEAEGNLSEPVTDFIHRHYWLITNRAKKTFGQAMLDTALIELESKRKKEANAA